ncbi:MAG: C40 family peptidase [Gemmatimonadales bacterium]
MPKSNVFPARLYAVILFVAAPPLCAQDHGVELSVGGWWHDSASVIYAATYYQALVGPLSYGIGVNHQTQVSGAGELRQTGGEFSLALGRGSSGPYVLAGVGLGIRHTDRNLSGQWSAGGGYAFRPLSFLSLGVEARYLVEDSDLRGFWRLRSFDRRGVALSGRLSIGLRPRSARSRGRPRARGTVGRPGRADGDYTPPTESEIADNAGRDGASKEAVRLREGVVQTAIAVMGTPYRWGGTDANGFDCSGLIKYAYGEHGLIIPRVSRDQARTGMLVERAVEALMPGDILGFSVERAGVTHVGLYVGDGKFIHSASSGVKISNLAAKDSESGWWRARWVAARRIIN